ncbi:MAG: protein kinase, partial [Myxococcota bacterium]
MERTRSLQERTTENPRRFRFHRCLGQGGYGEVYRATMWRDGGVSTEVAVKVLAAELDPTGDAVRRLTDEGRLLGALNHPVILKVVDLVVLGGRAALVTEFVEGQDLVRAMGPGAAEPLPKRALVEVIGRVAEALHAAWTTASPYDGGPMHLVHRDVKPHNIRLGVHGQVKLLDFGIARAAGLDADGRTSNTSSPSRPSLLTGSWPYLAPERVRDEASDPGPEVDVYGLGCTLFEGLGGQRLLEGYKLLDLVRIIEQDGGLQSIVDARVAELTARAPPPVLKLLARMLSSDPVDRPAPDEVAQRCEDLAEAMPGANLKRWARDRRWPAPDEQDGPLTDLDLTEGTLDIPKRKPKLPGSPGTTPPLERTVPTREPTRSAPADPAWSARVPAGPEVPASDQPTVVPSESMEPPDHDPPTERTVEIPYEPPTERTARPESLSASRKRAGASPGAAPPPRLADRTPSGPTATA